MKALLPALLIFLIGITSSPAQNGQPEPVKVVVAGLAHGHVHWILGRDDEGAIEIVGIAESDRDLRNRFAGQYDLGDSLFYDDLKTALDQTDAEAVTAYGPIYDHLKVVEVSAPRDVHVMVEKPLAVSLEQARKMKALADKHQIHLLTNYETTWYASNRAVYEKLHGDAGMGDVRKMIARDGHRGPREIGVSKPFLSWLTDPKLNGGGALMDFGCYGANLMTWMMDGREPLAVRAVTQQIKPEVYPEVDDEATIILTYPKAQGIIQASWNWPYSRKDLEVYGQHGYAIADDGRNIRYRSGDQKMQHEQLQPRAAPYSDPFSYLASVVRGETSVSDTDLSSLTNNMTVMKILEAAKKSAESGRTVEVK